jgi:hypothetical protein
MFARKAGNCPRVPLVWLHSLARKYQMKLEVTDVANQKSS